MKALSCGFVIINANNQREILACLPYGKSKGSVHSYDIPKGHKEMGETTLDAAIRELREETGLVVDTSKVDIYDCGMFQYLKDKDLYIYLMFADIDIHTLRCDSKFPSNGKMVNEIIGYEWTDNIEIFYKSLQPIITDCIKNYRNGYYEKID